MPDLDPYAVLGVPRTATREEVARAFRRLAKQHHPDAGAPVTTSMARINEAWAILGSPSRRATWDEAHRVTQPPAWTAGPVDRMRHRPDPTPVAPPSRFDSPWAAVGVVLAVVLLIGVVTAGLAIASAGDDQRTVFTSDDLTLRYPSDWTVEPGLGSDPPEHRIVAHLATYGVDPAQLCRVYGDACSLNAEAIPPGNASVLITAWEGDDPPLTPSPSGLTVDGRPAAFDLATLDDDLHVARWQLSPDGYPGRWVDVRAVIRGLPLDRDKVLRELRELVASIELPSSTP